MCEPIAESDGRGDSARRQSNPHRSDSIIAIANTPEPIARWRQCRFSLATTHCCETSAKELSSSADTISYRQQRHRHHRKFHLISQRSTWLLVPTPRLRGVGRGKEEVKWNRNLTFSFAGQAPNGRHYLCRCRKARPARNPSSHSPIAGCTAESPGEAAAQPCDCWRMTAGVTVARGDEVDELPQTPGQTGARHTEHLSLQQIE